MYCFSHGGIPIAYCDAGVALDEGYVPNLRSASEDMFPYDAIKYRTKEYPVELKPLFSAFGLKSLVITSIRSFLLFYLPLLEPRPPADDDEEFLEEIPEERHVDLVTPFKNSVKQIFREVRLHCPLLSSSTFISSEKKSTSINSYISMVMG